ncbi:hypothetical protein [Actinokineospora sp.]|uniref:hypothetical protein n=1 Tax=Actinokineospora sp. TaxID=1872133 RepID=UPI004037CDD1
MNRLRAGVLTLTAVAALGFTVLVPALHSAAAEQKPCSPTSKRDCLARLKLNSGAQLPYYGTYPLAGATAPTGAVIVVHGTGRNAKGYFERMVQAAGNFGPRTQIVAPWFQTKDEKPASGDAYWTNGGDQSWKDGGNAVRPNGLSSFETMDDILRTLADKARFPNLTKVTLVGHSAGGQFVQRYAAGGRAPAAITGIEFSFVVANPSSYLYLDSKRPIQSGLGSCPEYNDYKYGLKRRNAYLAKSTDAQIRDQYSTRKVTYLLGEKDVLQDDSLDLDCPAKAQGKNRFDRGSKYFAAIRLAFPSAPHKMTTVRRVGHDSEAMFTSPEGKAAIFTGW